MRETCWRRIVEMVVLSMVVVWPKVVEARVNELVERVQITDLTVEDDGISQEKLLKFYQIEVEQDSETLRTITERMQGLENEHKYLLQQELEGLHEKIADHQPKKGTAGLSATSNAESETKKKRGFERLLQWSTKEMEDKMSSVQEELEEAATRQQQELTESLELATTEKKQLEDTYRKSSEQLFGTENLRNELKVSQEKLEGIGNELEATKTREAETIQKLKSAEEQLKEKVTLHETYTRDSKLKIQETVVNFTSRDTEAISFLEKSRNLEHHLKAYEVLLAQSTGRFVLLKEELYQLLLIKTNTEIENEELKRIISESNDNAAKTTYENEMLAATIIQLKYKINELEISPSTPHGEKESSMQKHDSHSRAYEVADKEGKELSEANLKLTQEVASYESKLNDLQTSLSAALSEKDETLNQLHISKKAIEDLTQKFTSEGQKLQSQISSLVEKNKMLNETYENTRKGIQTFIATLEVEVKEHTSNETSLKTEHENLKAAMEDKAELKKNLKNLEEKLAAAQNTIVKQVSEVGFEEDLLAKESQLEELKRKLQEEESAKVLIQDKLKNQEAHLILIQEQLAKATNEKDALDAVVFDLRTDLAQTKDHRSDLEAKLQLSTGNLKAEEEEAKLQANELKKQSELLELKRKETRSELEKCSAQLSGLNSTLTSLEEEKKQSTDKVIQLQSELAQSSTRNTKLELELKSAVEKYAHYETRAKRVHPLSVRLEDMIQTLNFKSETSGQRASELLLETKEYRIQELEEQISTLERKCKETEEGSIIRSRKVSELESELDALQSEATALEAALETATKKEQELTESLDLVTAEKERLRKSSEQLVETENSLNVTQEKLEGIENELEATKMREAETIQKLKSAEEQLKEKVTLHETHTRDLESRLNDCQTSLSAALREKNETLNQLHISKKAIEDLTQKFTTSQISSLVEEKKMLNKTHESAKKKLQTFIATLEVEVEVKENTSNEMSLKTVLENLMAEMEENAAILRNILKNLEEKLAAAQNTIIAQKEIHLQRELERDAALKEVEAKNASLSHLETQIKDLTEKLKAKPKDEVSEVGFEEDLLAKESQLEELKRKLQEEESAKVLIQDKLKNQEAHLILIQEQLAKATNEKDALDAVVFDLRTDLAQTKDHRSDLEAKLQLSTGNLKAEEEEAKLQANELKKQSELLELKRKETRSELEKCSAQLSGLNSTLTSLEEEKKQSTDKVIQLQSELAQSSTRNTKLELELKSAVEKYAHYETRAKRVHPLSVRLEDMIQTLNFKSETSGQRASELLLETKEYRIQELEEQISTLERKCKETEEGSIIRSRKVSELESELDALQSEATALEAALETATKKEQELTESLDLVTAEKERLRKSSEQLVETENSLNVTQEKLEGIENELEATKMREAETIQKLKSAEEQLKEKVTLHETHTRDLESRLNDCQTSLSAALREKNETLNQLHISKKAIEDLTQKFTTSEGQRLQSQIWSLVEENKKLRTFIATLQVEVKEYTSKETSLKTELEFLKVEMEEKAELKNKLKYLKEILATAQNTIIEQKEIHSQVKIERDAPLKEVEAKNASVSHLETLIKYLKIVIGSSSDGSIWTSSILVVVLVSIIVGILVGKRY